MQALLQHLTGWLVPLADDLSRRHPDLAPERLSTSLRQFIERLLFLHACAKRHIIGPECLQAALAARSAHRRLHQLFAQTAGPLAVPWHDREPPFCLSDGVLRRFAASLAEPEWSNLLADPPPNWLAQVHEQLLGCTLRVGPDRRAALESSMQARRAAGRFYTPSHLVEYLIEHTLPPLLANRRLTRDEPLRLVDPACGAGHFLLAAYEHLLERYRAERPAPWSRRQRLLILRRHIFGVDLDPQAVEVARLSLFLLACGKSRAGACDWSWAANIQWGDALLGYEPGPPDAGPSPQLALGAERAFTWHGAFPEVIGSGGFDAVLGNPPWGQKGITLGRAEIDRLRSRFHSLAGIFDLFRPFVELGIALLRPQGRLGLVLPDIVLLKDYVATRRLLLDELQLDRLDWWGQAFRAAEIDVATLIGTKGSAGPDHTLVASVHDGAGAASHRLRQFDFRANDRLTLNLHLTAEKRQRLDLTALHPRLGDYFEIHEGVHSGNMRHLLFVAQRCDRSCRELLARGSEMTPYRLAWSGRYLRLSALDSRARRGDRANLGQRTWHERPKLLVRRTGDRVLAAVDEQGRFVSNNFFLVFPKVASPFTLDGLCALLNSPQMTWLFRTIEPRQGRAFAELKIKHLAQFPLPLGPPGLVRALNHAGRRRAQLAAQAARDIQADSPGAPAPKRVSHLIDQWDRHISDLVEQLFFESAQSSRKLRLPAGA